VHWSLKNLPGNFIIKEKKMPKQNTETNFLVMCILNLVEVGRRETSTTIKNVVFVVVVAFTGLTMLHHFFSFLSLSLYRICI
jgi:hypothetical protein